MRSGRDDVRDALNPDRPTLSKAPAPITAPDSGLGVRTAAPGGSAVSARREVLPAVIATASPTPVKDDELGLTLRNLARQRVLARRPLLAFSLRRMGKNIHFRVNPFAAAPSGY